MARRRRFHYGYRASPACDGTWAYVWIQRDLGPTELIRLEEDLRLLSASIGNAKAAQIDLDVPLSRRMALALHEISQKLELPMNLSVPPLAPEGQASFSREFIASEGPVVTNGPFTLVEIRHA